MRQSGHKLHVKRWATCLYAGNGVPGNIQISWNLESCHALTPCRAIHTELDWHRNDCQAGHWLPKIDKPLRGKVDV